jgi:hypothetical protein
LAVDHADGLPEQIIDPAGYSARDEQDGPSVQNCLPTEPARGDVPDCFEKRREVSFRRSNIDLDIHM